MYDGRKPTQRVRIRVVHDRLKFPSSDIHYWEGGLKVRCANPGKDGGMSKPPKKGGPEIRPTKGICDIRKQSKSLLIQNAWGKNLTTGTGAAAEKGGRFHCRGDSNGEKDAPFQGYIAMGGNSYSLLKPDEGSFDIYENRDQTLDWVLKYLL